MLPQEVIRKKRDKQKLTMEEIVGFVDGVANWSVSDGQIAALCMAIYLNDLDIEEIVHFINAVLDTGMVLDWNVMDLDGPVVDAMSTGGVGDKVDIISAPILAACGAYVPMITGPGILFTGGTLDKVEAVPNYQTNISNADFKKTVKNTGLGIIGPTSQLTSAEKRVYAIREMSVTVGSIDLITISILSKKLAAGIKDSLFLDVKYGKGSYSPDYSGAETLAQTMCDAVKIMGINASGMISDMNKLYSRTVGNALELKEVFSFLKNEYKNEKLYSLVKTTVCETLKTSKLAFDDAEAEAKLQKVLNSGEALERFAKMFASLGASAELASNPDKILPKAKVVKPVYADEEGVISDINAKLIGKASIFSGAGRTEFNQKIDYAAGFSELKNIGESVEKGEPIAFVHATDETRANEAAKRLKEAYEIGGEEVKQYPDIYKLVNI